jgi:hypothetical protein
MAHRMCLPVRSRDSSSQDWTNPLTAFLVNQSVQTTTPRLQVETRTATDTSGATALRPGVHRFRLIVINDEGVQSDPVIAEVRVTQALIVQPIIVQPIITQPFIGQPIIPKPNVVGPQLISTPVISRIPRSEEIVGSPTKGRQATKPASKSKSSKKPKPTTKPASKSKSSKKPKPASTSKSSKKRKPPPKG